jgi:RHS repeat-associated protein
LFCWIYFDIYCRHGLQIRAIGFNDVNLTPIDFEYDANGNMIKDHNKGITLITYNHLNLPTTIQFGSINTITYIYNAIGQKVLKKVRTGNEYANTDYLTGFQYRSSYTETQGNQSTAELQYFPTTEGYVQQKDGRYFYVYHYTDHLGNIRLSYTLDPETQMIKIMEENHYYPFGLKHEFYNTATMKFAEKIAPNTNESMIVLEQANNFVGDGSYNYKYNGKELQDELGLNITAMDFRMYDNALGRFHSMDKMTDILPSLSPYRFAFNNPVKWNDPSGLLESGDPDPEKPVAHFVQPEVVLTATRTSSSSEITRPAQFNYSLMDYSSPHRRVSLNDYNKAKGTNYSSFDDYYFNEKYKPAYKQNISNIHSATNSAAVAILTTAAVLTGSAYLMPVVASASPAISSFTASAVTNPLVQQGALNMGLNAGSQYIANGGVAGDINMIEVASSGVPGTNLIPTVVGETFSFTSNEGFQTPDSFSQWSIQVGGGILSNRFGKATDNYLGGEGVKGAVVGEYFKFIVETGSNAAPNLVKE